MQTTTANPILKDLSASIVIFLVAIPLCIGIAIAAGLPTTYGLISGIIGGLVCSTLGGCKLQVSGPTAGQITLVWDTIQNHGIENYGAIILLAGLMQIGFSLLQVGQWFRAVSPALVQGMLAGIGMLIFASQFHVMLDDKPTSSGLENLMAIPSAIMKGVLPMDNSTHHLAGLVGILTIIVILGWSYAPKTLKAVPAPLAGIIVAVVISTLLNLPISYVTVPKALFAFEHMISLGSATHLFSHSSVIAALSIAIVASTESLLTATAIDRLSNAKEKTDYNKELKAQGLGNMVAGALGVLPISGVIVRGAANVQAGAVSRRSGFFHALWLLLFLIAFPNFLEHIPVCSLAAVLVYSGYKLINPTAIKGLARVGKSEVAIYAATLTMIVTTSLLEGIIVGFVLSSIKLIKNLAIFSTNVISNDEETSIYLTGSATFLNLPALAEVLERMEGGKTISVYFDDLNYIDHACMDLLLNWEKQYIEQGGQVKLMLHNHASALQLQQQTQHMVGNRR